MKKATILYQVENNEVLLAKKKRKVGVGYYFGYGGKVEGDETPEACTVREFNQESGGCEIAEDSLKRMALIDFYRGDMPFGDPLFQVLFFVGDGSKMKGTPVETEEMGKPDKFAIHKLPLLEMKPGDELILNEILFGKMVKGFLRFNADTDEVIEYELKPCLESDLVL